LDIDFAVVQIWKLSSGGYRTRSAFLQWWIWHCKTFTSLFICINI